MLGKYAGQTIIELITGTFISLIFLKVGIKKALTELQGQLYGTSSGALLVNLGFHSLRPFYSYGSFWQCL